MPIPNELQDWFDALPEPRKVKNTYPPGRGRTQVLTEQELADLRRLVGVTPDQIGPQSTANRTKR